MFVPVYSPGEIHVLALGLGGCAEHWVSTNERRESWDSGPAAEYSLLIGPIFIERKEDKWLPKRNVKKVFWFEKSTGETSKTIINIPTKSKGLFDHIFSERKGIMFFL